MVPEEYRSSGSISFPFSMTGLMLKTASVVAHVRKIEISARFIPILGYVNNTRRA